MLNRSGLPRPEYPRPDRQRGRIEGADWLNLNGPWDFRFDGDRQGIDERWFDPSNATSPFSEQIIVPFCWESLAAWREADSAGNDHYFATRVFRDTTAVNRANHRSAPRYEVGWYRREIHIPRDAPEWAGKRVILTVGAADFFTDGWCNGQPLGRHEGGYTPFEFDLTDALDADGKGMLVLRVEDPMDNSHQPVGKQWGWYTTTSGIWQTVFVEPRHASHIAPFRITPNLARRTATFRVPCVAAREGDELEIILHQPFGQPALALEAEKHTLTVRDGVAEGGVPVGRLVLWDQYDPALYHVNLRLVRAGQVLDEVRSYFGMREITTQAKADGSPGAVCLNGRPLYLRGALHQSFYPEGVYTAGDAATLRDDIAFAKKAGFDFLRIHVKIDDPLLLYYADTAGILLMVDFPNFGEGGNTPLGHARFETMMRAAIERDFNHPAIIAWCLFNEAWGFGGERELGEQIAKRKRLEERKLKSALPLPENDIDSTGQKKEAPPTGSQPVAQMPSKIPKIPGSGAHKWVRHMWNVAKALDATRLIEDMSVHDWDRLEYYEHTETDINSWHFYKGDYDKARAHIEKVVSHTYAGSRFNFVQGFEQGSQPLITSEYGGVGALGGDRDTAWSFKFLTNELRRQPKLSAYVYTELHDVEYEHNGFLKYDRTPKVFGYDPALINAPDVLTVDAAPARRAAPGERVRVNMSSSHYGTREFDKVILRWRLSGVDDLGRVHVELAQGSAPIPFTQGKVAPAGVVEFALPESGPMLCKLALEAVDTRDGAVIAGNYIEYLVTPGYPPAASGNVLRAAPGEWTAAEWSEGSCTREEASKADACHGASSGFFEWTLSLGKMDWNGARRLRILCEASSRRRNRAQTSLDLYPTTLRLLLNGELVHTVALPNHPHDARGVLSYLRGAKGAYGYLTQIVVEGALLSRVRKAGRNDHLRLRCEVPADVPARNGLTLYGPECGRYPFGVTVLLE